MDIRNYINKIISLITINYILTVNELYLFSKTHKHRHIEPLPLFKPLCGLAVQAFIFPFHLTKGSHNALVTRSFLWYGYIPRRHVMVREITTI